MCSILVAALVLTGSPLFSLHAPEKRGADREKTGRGGKFPPGSVLHKDLTYGTSEAGTSHQLDLVRPGGKGPFPVVIFLHGGGWATGNRTTYHPYMAPLVGAGYVAVTVGYRLAPKHPFPAAVHDVKRAVRWLRANAGKYGIDARRIGVVGYSAGGHLACLLGTTHGNKELEGEGCAGQSSRVQAVVSYYGLTDLAALHRNCAKQELPVLEQMRMSFALSSFLPGTPGTQPERFRLASPITHVTGDASPTLLIHGVADRQVPLQQSLLFEKKMRCAGAEVALLKVKGAGHNFVGAFEKESNEAMLRFLARHLKKN